jgi:oxygen-dependent protoporphyrinogen oxidase
MMLKSKIIYDLLLDLGILDKVQWPEPSSKIRYISSRDGLFPIKIPSLLSPLAGLGGLLRILSGGLATKGQSELSVYDFFARRFGKTVTENLVVPFVSGIYAGDAKKLLVSQAFPNLHLWDQQFNSLWSGVIASQKDGIPKKGIVSFDGGMETLPKAIVAKLNPEYLRAGVEVSEVSCISGGYRVKTATEIYDCKKLILTIPPKQLASVLCGPEFLELAQALNNIYSPWLAVHHFAFPKNATRDLRRGFGFLSTQNEGDKHILGCLWPTSSFPTDPPLIRKFLRFFVAGPYTQRGKQRVMSFRKTRFLRNWILFWD